MTKTSFELQPTLSGSLIQLRPLSKDDFADLYESASDPQIWEQHPQRNRHEKAVFQKFFEGAIESGGAFTIIDLKTNRIIGSSRYYGLDDQSRQIIIGYTFLKTEYWGGKFNRELKTLMLNHAFRFVDSVLFEIGTNNQRSRKAIEKFGATLVRNANLDGHSHVVYEISKKNFVDRLG